MDPRNSYRSNDGANPTCSQMGGPNPLLIPSISPSREGSIHYWRPYAHWCRSKIYKQMDRIGFFFPKWVQGPYPAGGRGGDFVFRWYSGLFPALRVSGSRHFRQKFDYFREKCRILVNFWLIFSKFELWITENLKFDLGRRFLFRWHSGLFPVLRVSGSCHFRQKFDYFHQKCRISANFCPIFSKFELWRAENLKFDLGRRFRHANARLGLRPRPQTRK